MSDQKVVRFRTETTKQRVDIIEAIAEGADIDRHTAINQAMYGWVVERVDVHLREKVKEIFCEGVIDLK